jgi:5-(carboxyamino)imidazole ribonucleotide synthase
MIRPGSVLGLLGGGQLGAMFSAEAVRMGYQVVVVDPDPFAPAARFAIRHIRSDWTDPAIVEELAQLCSAVTTEWENVPAAVLRALEAHLPVRPSADSVEPCQDRIAEKDFLALARVPTVRWAPVRRPEDIEIAWSRIDAAEAILKTARLGYDGKGQARIESRAGLATAWENLGQVSCILEQRVDLATEVSVIVARSSDGEVRTWPVGENVHSNGILHTTVVPAAITPQLAEQAGEVARTIVDSLEYVGVMGVECFVTTGGDLLVNELAPRPHNSGHWTLEAAVTSQFEQQVRILAGMPLGSTDQVAPVAMVNLLGDLWNDGAPHFERALALPGVRLHLYGKREARPGRKMGHLTVTASSAAEARGLALEAWRALD